MCAGALPPARTHECIATVSARTVKGEGQPPTREHTSKHTSERTSEHTQGEPVAPLPSPPPLPPSKKQRAAPRTLRRMSFTADTISASSTGPADGAPAATEARPAAVDRSVAADAAAAEVGVPPASPVGDRAGPAAPPPPPPPAPTEVGKDHTRVEGIHALAPSAPTCTCTRLTAPHASATTSSTLQGRRAEWQRIHSANTKHPKSDTG